MLKAVKAGDKVKFDPGDDDRKDKTRAADDRHSASVLRVRAI